MGYPEVSELKCSCGLPAKLRLSQTSKNPFRLFYNCSRGLNDQCEFFQWFDEPALTGDRHIDEVNLIRHHCTRLQERLNEVQQERDNNRNVWEMEKSELISQLSDLQADVDGFKKKIKMANESDLMPPLDKLSDADEDGDGVIVIQTV